MQKSTLITNGKKIIIQDHNLDNLEKIMNEVTKTARERFGNDKIKFKFVDEKGFPHYENSNNLSFEQLKEVVVENGIDIKMRAFGNEVIILPAASHKDIKHFFTLDEKAQIADVITRKVAEKETLEDEKKQSAKKYADMIDIIDTEISDKSRTYREGYDIRTTKVVTQMDFETGYKMFLDPDTKECLHSEKLDTRDYQLRMDYDQEFQEADADDEIDSSVDQVVPAEKKTKGKGSKKASKKKKGEETAEGTEEKTEEATTTDEDELPLGDPEAEDENAGIFAAE